MTYVKGALAAVAFALAAWAGWRMIDYWLAHPKAVYAGPIVATAAAVALLAIAAFLPRDKGPRKPDITTTI